MLSLQNVLQTLRAHAIILYTFSGYWRAGIQVQGRSFDLRSCKKISIASCEESSIINIIIHLILLFFVGLQSSKWNHNLEKNNCTHATFHKIFSKISFGYKVAKVETVCMLFMFSSINKYIGQ